MPARSRSASERAEARRRARAVARGEEVAPDEVSPAPAAARPPSILGRLFPPAPPLPGKGDPLAGFSYRGRFRGLVSGGWLLFRHPLAWGVAAAGWALFQFVLIRISAAEDAGGAPLFTFGITLAQYGLLIGAGWFGWQRPWLFGAMAGLMGTVLLGLIVGLEAFVRGDSPSVVALALGVGATYGVLYGLIGGFAGFYGGYLRRRMAAQSAAAAKGKRR